MTGTASEFDGSLDDYIDFVLARDQPAAGKAKRKGNRKEARRAAAEARDKARRCARREGEGGDEVARLAAERRSAIDRAMFDPAGADADSPTLTMTELMKRRAEDRRADRRPPRRAGWRRAKRSNCWPHRIRSKLRSAACFGFFAAFLARHFDFTCG